MDLSREHSDPYAADQAPLGIDRRRVIHSASFRRLQYKTQVFVSRHGDHFRSRLTHTLEVAALARTIAERVGLCADLAEVAALTHDLGHPPFGHAGERALHECLSSDGGRFEHNEHTLRVVTELEHPYPEFRGLNLTRAVRLCLQSHTTRYDQPKQAELADVPLESQVVDRADELAYTSHDFQDGLYAGLLGPEELRQVELWRLCYTGPEAPQRSAALRYLRPTVECMQAVLIDDLSGTSDESRVAFSERGRGLLDEMNELLHKHVYKNAQVVQMDSDARRMVKGVFAAYLQTPTELPPRYRERLDCDGITRVATDYVAGMTDRYCESEYQRLCGEN